MFTGLTKNFNKPLRFPYFFIFIFEAMLKSIAHSFISLFFIIALLGPSVFQLCAKDVAPIVLTIQEEEVKEKIFSITDFISHIVVFVPKNELNTAYIEKPYIYNSEVFLQPPEHTS